MPDFNLLIETFQKDTLDDDNQETKENNDHNNCNIFEEKKIDKPIVMDDVSGLADKLNDFNKFLTVSQKFGYIYLYIFHIIHLSKSIWQKILSQTKIFNIFPSLIQLRNILNILTNSCGRETISYIPAGDLWINRLYCSLSNESKNYCLTIDCRKSGPAKYRSLNNSVIMVKIKRTGFLINS